MATFQESAAKGAIRQVLRSACEDLQRSGLTYLGLPGEHASDIKVLGSLLRNVICVDTSNTVLEEARRSIAMLPLHSRVCCQSGMWQYLRDHYPAEPLLADVTFLDFCGGGIQHDDPFAIEIAGLRSYFAKHASNKGMAFILAWTYMPRDKGIKAYTNAVSKVIAEPELIDAMRKTTGVWLRSAAVRLLLWKSLTEHGMKATMFHHAVYKKTMNTVILVFSKGDDDKSRIQLSTPDSILHEPACIYDGGGPVPAMVPVMEL